MLPIFSFLIGFKRKGIGMSNKTTEQASHYQNLEKMSTQDLLQSMNTEDQKVPEAVRSVIPQLQSLVDAIVTRMEQGGRLFYLGSGTSGRLGILDASECPPTFGVEDDWVIGLIAGGDQAIRKSQEFAEDDTWQAWQDLKAYAIHRQDTVIGLSASGSTPYVLGGLKACGEQEILTGCITCNAETPVAQMTHHPIEAIIGPEFVTGSTRLKAGTAQKLILNMISTSVMIRLGRVKGNQMVDMQLSNEKLIDRGARMIQNLFGLTYEESKELLLAHGSVRKVIAHYDFKEGRIK